MTKILLPIFENMSYNMVNIIVHMVLCTFCAVRENT